MVRVSLFWPLATLLLSHHLFSAESAPEAFLDVGEKSTLDYGAIELSAQHERARLARLGADAKTIIAEDMFSGLSRDQLEALSDTGLRAPASAAFHDCETNQTTPATVGKAMTLSQFNVQCSKDKMMGRWRVVPVGGKFAVNYTCCSYRNPLENCQTLETNSSTGNDILDFRHHALNCPADKGMTQWRLKEGDVAGKSFKFEYECCELNDDWAFTDCGDEKSPLTNQMDAKVPALEYHNVKCSEGTVMTKYKLNAPLAGKIEYEWGCCSVEPNLAMAPFKGVCYWYGDPHFIPFDNPDTPQSFVYGVASAKKQYDFHAIMKQVFLGTYWIVKSKWVSVQSIYSDVALYPFMPPTMKWASTAISVGGLFMRGHRLIFYPTNTTYDNVKILDGATSTWEDTVLGADIKVTDGAGTPFQSITVNLPLDVTLNITRTMTTVEGTLIMSRMQGGQDGHCGNFNNDSSDDTVPKIFLRNNNMQVEDKDTLFNIPGQKQHEPPKECSGANKTKATNICKAQVAVTGSDDRNAGLEDTWLKTCVYDVCMGAGEAFAKKSAEGIHKFEDEKTKLAPLQYKIVEKVGKKDLVQGTAGSTLCGDKAEVAMPRSYAEQDAVRFALALSLAEHDSIALIGGKWKSIETAWIMNNGQVLNPMCQYTNYDPMYSWRTGPSKAEMSKSLCLETRSGNWKACDMSAGNVYSKHIAVCSPQKSYVILGDVTPVKARTACGMGMQLAMPKSKEEQAALFEIVKGGAASARVWLGARYTNNRWFWDDDQPFCDYTNWDPNAAASGMSADPEKDEFLCMHPEHGTWLNCGFDKTQTYNVACESVLQPRPCKEGALNASDVGMGQDSDSTYAPVQGYCYYYGRAGQNCDQVCKEQMDGECDLAGTQRLTKSLTVCRTVVDTFGNFTYSGEDSAINNTDTTQCVFQKSYSGAHSAVTLFLNRAKPYTTCQANGRSGSHRICACKEPEDQMNLAAFQRVTDSLS